MDQSDLDLLQTVPAYHLQSVIKMRHIPLSSVAFNTGPSSGLSASSSAIPVVLLELAGYLFDPVSIVEALRELGELEVTIMRELVACGGRANSRDLALYCTSAGLLAPMKKADMADLDGLEAQRGYQPILPPQPPQYPPAHPHGIFEQALRRLLVLGLLFWGRQTNFAGRDYTSGIHDGVLIVPFAVRSTLRQEWQLERDAFSGQQDVGDGARALQRALYLYWSLVAGMREGLALVNNGLLSRAALRSVLEHLDSQKQYEQVRSESEAPRLLFQRLLLMKLGLLVERHNALYAARADDFFVQSLSERARLCCRTYLESPFWNELLYLPGVLVRPGPTPLEPAHEEILRARQTLIERIRFEEVGVWRDMAAFIARTKLYVPYLLFPRQYGPRTERYSSGSNPYAWDFRLHRGWLTHREGWHMVEGGFIRTAIAGPLHWLGLFELDHEDHATAFRLVAGAGVIVGAVAPVEQEAVWGRLIVQPNFELVALAPVSESLLVNLDRFAERISLEHIAQYRLSKSSVSRAIQRGLHSEEIQVVLERAVGSEIPQNVRYSLVEWERQARRIELWPRTQLLEVDEAALLDELFANPTTRALLGRRLTERLAEVAPHHLAAIQELLWQRNYLPALIPVPTLALTENPVLREPQWRLYENGLLEPCYAVLDLYLVAEVERFAEKDASAYRLTAASVRRALEGDITLDQILRFLQQYCEHGIPAALLIRLKLWGNGYGSQQDILVERVPLLSLSAEVLHDLQTDSELSPLLGPEVAQQRRLVRIPPQNLERLLTLLRDRGFTLDS